MQEDKARRVVAALRELGVDAVLERPSVYQFGVAVQLPAGRRAVWGADSGASLGADVLRDGVLVGFVPAPPDSADLTEQQVVELIARTDYDAPAGSRRERPMPAGPPLAVRRGLFARAMEGFR